MDGLYDLSGNPPEFVYFIRYSFACWRTCPGLKTTKELTLSIERGGIWEPHVATRGALDLIQLVSNLPVVEVVNFYGVPPLELSSILGLLSHISMFKPQCPNLKRLVIVSSPLPSPSLLFAELGKLLTARKEAGVPF